MGTVQFHKFTEMFVKLLIFLWCQLFVTTADCPAGWSPAGPGDACYLISSAPMTWFEAQEYCWDNGAYLAEFKSGYEENIVEQILPLDRHYWIGLNEISHIGTWRWSESHSVAEYTNWATHQPDYDQTDNCVFRSMQEYESLSPGWHNLGCELSSWYVNIHALCESSEVRK